MLSLHQGLRTKIDKAMIQNLEGKVKALQHFKESEVPNYTQQLRILQAKNEMLQRRQSSQELDLSEKEWQMQQREIEFKKILLKVTSNLP